MKPELDRLGLLLEEAVKKCCDKKTGALFSSGIDSALIALIASRHCEITAYTVGGVNSEDIRFSKKSQKEFTFPIKIIEVGEKEVEEILPHLLELVGSPDPLKVSVGVPMYFAAKAAAEDGFKSMLSGQGGDELFGGYSRYLSHAVKGDYASLKKAMDGDVASAYEDNLDRDKAIFKAFGIDLRFPYMDKAFSEYVMSIPYQLKIPEIREGEDEFGCADEVGGRKFIRKYLQRQLAEKFGLPQFILDRRKKAAQYGSESEKIIKRLAQKKGFKEKARQAGRRNFVELYLESLT